MIVTTKRCDTCKVEYNNNPESDKYMVEWGTLRSFAGYEYDVCANCQIKLNQLALPAANTTG